MTTTITTSVSMVTQKQERQGDVMGLPVLTIQEKHSFDTDAQAENYRNDLIMWLQEIPYPNGDLSFFPKRKVAPTETELNRILDDIHGPGELWEDSVPVPQPNERKK